MQTDSLQPAAPDDHFIERSRVEALEVENDENSIRTIVRLIDDDAITDFESEELEKLRIAFGQERARFIELLRTRRYRRHCYGTGYRTIRDEIVATDRKAKKLDNSAKDSHCGLQARHWKMALQSAAIVVSNYWRLVQVNARSVIFSKKWTKNLNEAERTYILMVLNCLRPEFFDLLDGGNPEFRKLEMKDVRDLPKLCLRIRRVVWKTAGRFPSPGRAATVWFDQQCYTVHHEKDCQYVDLTSMTRGKRIRVKLLGKGKVASVIRLVFREDGSLALHVMTPLRRKPLANVPEAPEGMFFCRAFDMGFTEAFTDDAGKQYGGNLGELLKKLAEELNRKLEERNRLQSLFRNTKSRRKRRNLLRFNLGSDRFDAFKARLKTQIRICINQALNEMFEKAPADAYIVEELSAQFLPKKGLSKRCRRLLSGWVRGIISERLAFKAAERGLKLVKVAAAYSSQTCPDCLYADRENRKGDRFKCVSCGGLFHADQVGARNLLRRVARGGWKTHMSKEEAWELSRKEYEEECRKTGREALPDPHCKKKKARKSTKSK